MTDKRTNALNSDEVEIALHRIEKAIHYVISHSRQSSKGGFFDSFLK